MRRRLTFPYSRCAATSFSHAPLPLPRRALYEAEAKLNAEIASAGDVFKAGQAIPETMKAVHEAERALRTIEAAAATIKTRNALRDNVVSQLDYLVSLKQSAAGETGGLVLRTATAAVTSKFETDASLQQKSIDIAIKALASGSSSAADDIVAPTFEAALAAAKKDAASKPSTSPFKSEQQKEIFEKRFAGGPVNAWKFVK